MKTVQLLIGMRLGVMKIVLLMGMRLGRST